MPDLIRGYPVLFFWIPVFTGMTERDDRLVSRLILDSAPVFTGVTSRNGVPR